jgi:hypothetical protein
MQECWIDLIDNVAFSPSGRNQTLINLSQTDDPVWRGVFLTPLLAHTERPVWSSWRKSLRGGLKTFIAYDVRHSRPLAYPNANASTDIQGGWNGTAAVTSLAVGGVLGLSGLALNYQFKAGDRVGLEQSGKYGYYEVLEDVLGNGSGVASITVAPFLHTGLFTTSAVCRVWRPVCQFVIDQNSWNEQGTVEITPISFNGFQRL